jgi:hypothetical protein
MTFARDTQLLQETLMNCRSQRCLESLLSRQVYHEREQGTLNRETKPPTRGGVSTCLVIQRFFRPRRALAQRDVRYRQRG